MRLIERIKPNNTNQEILLCALGIDWANYRHANGKKARRVAKRKVHETLVLFRNHA